MKILTDIGHPKNVHVLKNVFPLLQRLGHEFHCVYRERENLSSLLSAFGIAGKARGAGASSIAGKFLYLLKTDLQFLKMAQKIKPDLLLSFASPYLAHVSRMTGIPMVVFDDTEENPIVQKIYAKTAAAIVVPECFGKELSPKQFRFPGYFELAYLHPRYLDSRGESDGEPGLPPGERFVLLRTVAWQALHDYRRRGLSIGELEDLVAAFSAQARVCISAEGALPSGLEALRLRTPAHRVHEVMARAALVFSEGATMAAEAAVLGVPTVHCSDLRPGYIADLDQRHGLLRSFAHKDFKAAMAAGRECLAAGAERLRSLQANRERMLEQSIDVAGFMAWFIDRFPASVDVMLADPKHAENFKH